MANTKYSRMEVGKSYSTKTDLRHNHPRESDSQRVALLSGLPGP